MPIKNKLFVIRLPFKFGIFSLVGNQWSSGKFLQVLYGECVLVHISREDNANNPSFVFISILLGYEWLLSGKVGWLSLSNQKSTWPGVQFLVGGGKNASRMISNVIGISGKRDSAEDLVWLQQEWKTKANRIREGRQRRRERRRGETTTFSTFVPFSISREELD